MTFFIYNPDSYQRLTDRHGDPIRTETERAAKGQLTKSGKDKSSWKVISSTDWYNNEPSVQVISLMSQKPVTIRLSEKGGCCDPSTERYWTM